MINKRYTIIEKIGEGRSKVFSCRDKYFPEEKVAIKILQYTANDSEIESFKNEYEIINRLAHPNIISVYDWGTILNLEEDYKKKYGVSENDKFITMERVDGVRFDKCRGLNDEKVLLDVIHQISLVLFYIHQSNYIYFDLKPENIIIYNLDGKFKVKIIDFGLANYFPNLESNYIRGTSEFLAPEILKKDEISFNVDLYSFGIMLYHLAYHKFPFRTESELEIFRAHIEKDFEFPSSKISNKIISLIKKLLNKNPIKRFTSSLEIINEINQDITFEEKLNLNIPLKFVQRKDLREKIVNYIEGNSWGNIIVLVGSKGSGKTSFLENLSKLHNSSVLIRLNNFISASNFWQQFFSRLLYSETIYRSIDDSLIQYVSLHIDDNSEELLEELKTIVSKIASISHFTLIIDDFDKLAVQDLELFIEIFPILLANQIKIIIALSSTSEIEFPKGMEVEIVELEPFSDSELKELVQSSYNDFINKRELENLLISFAERTPTSISYFISELIVAGIIDFSEGIISVKYDDSKITKVLSSQNEIFQLLKKSISEKGIKVLETIAIFENEISIELISGILDLAQADIIEATTSLRENNIIAPSTQNRNPSFINIGFKQFIYDGIINPQEKHLHAGKIILEYFPEMDDLSKIRQFEFANNFDDAKIIIDENLSMAKSNNFPKYRIKLLLKKLSYTLTIEERIKALLNLCEVYSNIGEYSKSLSLIKELNKLNLPNNSRFEKERLFGTLLIKTGDLSSGIQTLINVIDDLPDKKDSIRIELAGAFLEVNDYSKSDSICEEIINSSDTQSEIKGRAQNLLGISNLYNKSNLESTLKYFYDAHKTYTMINNFNRIAGSEVNLGNIQNILGNFNKAEKHWNKALQLNRSIGNVEQEANVLLSTGIFYYEHANYEKAIEVYNKAGDIFKGLGNKYRFGLVNTNLSETYLEISEYQRALNSIEKASEIFQNLKNHDELFEVLTLEGKLYILVENKDALSQTIDKMNELMPTKSEKGKYYFEFYLKYLEKMNSGYFNLDEIKVLREKFFKNNDRLIAAELQLLIADEYIKIKDYETSISLLHSKMLIDISKFNPKYEANRYYLLSRVPLKYQVDSTLTKNILLHKAYVILQNNSISELTVNVLNDLAKFYNDRGNIEKAKELLQIAETIVSYFKSQSKDGVIIKTLFENRFKNVIKSIDEILNSE